MSIVIGGAVMGTLLAFAFFFLIGVIVAIRISEAHRNGGGPFVKPPKIEIDPPDDPPDRPPVKKGADGLTRTVVVGGGSEPQFEDKAPAGGILIGLELAVVNNDSIKGVRPIYLCQGKEVKGALTGGDKANVVIKAKPGYAVSAVNVNAGLWIDGMSLTFARLTNGKVDLGDTYLSQYVGGNGGGRSVLGGNGMSIVGVITKKNGNENALHAIGFLLK
jgi:hypothetical protein